MANFKEYKKSLEDEIDWKIIDQLHTATLNFSTTSLELKKLFFVLVAVAVPSLVKMAGDKLDLSLFVTLYILSSAFWFLDGFTYYYQEKLREKMDQRFNEIQTRNKEALIVGVKTNVDEFTIENYRTSRNRISRSLLNLSVSFYLIMLGLNTIGFLLYILRVI